MHSPHTQAAHRPSVAGGYGSATARPHDPCYEGRVGENQMQDNDPTGLPDAEKLRELVRWYRAFAERAGSATIWAARLRMAEDLEREADRLGERAA